RPAVRADLDRVGGAEDADDGAVHGDGDVHRAGVVGDADRGAADELHQAGDGRAAGEVDGAGAGRGDRAAAGAGAGRADQDDGQADPLEIAGDLGEALDVPVLRLPDRAGDDDGEGPAGEAVGREEAVHGGAGLGREVDAEVGGGVVEAQHRGDPEVAVD